MWCDRRDALDSSEEACWGRRGSDARSDGEDSEKSGGLCEHDVGFGVVWWEKWWVLEGSGVLWLTRMSRKKECRNAPQERGR